MTRPSRHAWPKMASWLCQLAMATTLASCSPREVAPSPELHGSVPWEETIGEDFVLEDQHGQEFRLGDQRGRVVLLFFGYVHCPDVCPATLSTWARVRELIQADEDRVTFAFVTVDAERDSAELIGRHLAVFGSTFVGLTGSPEQLQEVYSSYDVRHEKVHYSTNTTGYIVDHSTRTLLIDTEGRLRARYDFDTRAVDIAEDIGRLLR